MTEIITDLKSRLTELYYQQKPDFLSEIRQKAIESFEKLGFPTTRHEEWKYANVQPIVKQELEPSSFQELSFSAFEKYKIEGLSTNVLVFFNGHFQSQLSAIISPDSEIVILPLPESIEEKSSTIADHFGKYADTKFTAFTALNTALANQGIVLRVLKNKVVSQPIVIYHISETDSPTLSQPRHLFVFEENSQATVVQVFKGENSAENLTNIVSEIVVRANANIEHFTIQQNDEKSYYIGTTEVVQQKDSKFSEMTVSLEGIFIRNNLHLILDAENCEAHMYGLYLLNDKQLVDNHTLADHRKPNSFSNELYKGVLDGKSTGVFNGKIFVRQDAQKTNAYQSNKSLVLSAEAAMNTKPQLEIFADDVKCTHGAAVGQLDENLLFYLQTRGIPKAQAKSLLTLAFANEVTTHIKNEALKAYLEKEIEKKLA